MGRSGSYLPGPEPWEYKTREERRQAALSSFYEEVEKLAVEGNIDALTGRMWDTRQREKVEAIARALREMGNAEAGEALLFFVSYPHPLNYVVWPYAVPFLAEDDAPRLLEIDEIYSTNSRMAAKYKLPAEAQELIVAYLRNRIGELPKELLVKALFSRYREVNNTAFELLLEHDTPETRKALAYMVQGRGDWRKKDRRAKLAFDKLLSLLEGDAYRELLRNAYGSLSQPVARKAAEMLSDLDSDFLLDRIRKKRYLSAIDIWKLREDGSPESIARIVRHGKGIELWSNPAKLQRESIRAFMGALSEVKTTEARRSLVSLLKEFTEGISTTTVYYQDEAISLCDILADRGERYALPALRAMADRGMGLPSYAAIRAILKLEGASPHDEGHPYIIKAKEQLERDRMAMESACEEMSSDEYILGEDLDIKASDRRCMALRERELSIAEWMLFRKD